MYVFLLIYLIINTTLTSSKTIYKVDGKRSTSDPKLSCKNIKCPPMEDPVCVKVTKIDKQKHEKFILAINKCNMQFMKCHPVGKVDDKDKNIYDDVEKQPRDIAKANLNDKVEQDLSDANDDLGEEDDKEEPADDNDELGDVNNKEEPPSNKYDDLGEEGNKEMNPVVDIDRSDDENNEENLPSDNDNEDSAGDNNDNLGYESNQEDVPSVKIEEPDDEYNGEDAKEDDTPLNLHGYEDEEDTNVVPVDYDQNTNDNVNSDEYKKNCSTDCPAREVMVCAKCQHNIYRSFLSSCHLRAFSCKHPDEKLELVNRNPCIQSAPYLTDLPSPKGRVSEPSDRDTVLQYIHCREKGRLNKDDPRCKFEEKQVETKEKE
ncbi:unnamed protein product, partial [Brenthis ino]